MLNPMYPSWGRESSPSSLRSCGRRYLSVSPVIASSPGDVWSQIKIIIFHNFKKALQISTYDAAVHYIIMVDEALDHSFIPPRCSLQLLSLQQLIRPQKHAQITALLLQGIKQHCWEKRHATTANAASFTAPKSAAKDAAAAAAAAPPQASRESADSVKQPRTSISGPVNDDMPVNVARRADAVLPLLPHVSLSCLNHSALPPQPPSCLQYCRTPITRIKSHGFKHTALPVFGFQNKEDIAANVYRKMRPVDFRGRVRLSSL